MRNANVTPEEYEDEGEGKAAHTANPERIAMIFLAVVTESFFRTAAVQKCLDGLEHLTGQEELPNSIEGRRRSKLIIFPASDDSKLQQIGSQEHQSLKPPPLRPPPRPFLPASESSTK